MSYTRSPVWGLRKMNLCLIVGLLLSLIANGIQLHVSRSRSLMHERAVTHWKQAYDTVATTATNDMREQFADVTGEVSNLYYGTRMGWPHNRLGMAEKMAAWQGSLGEILERMDKIQYEWWCKTRGADAGEL